MTLVSYQLPVWPVFYTSVIKPRSINISQDLQEALTLHLDQRYLMRKIIDCHHLKMAMSIFCRSEIMYFTDSSIKYTLCRERSFEHIKRCTFSEHVILDTKKCTSSRHNLNILFFCIK